MWAFSDPAERTSSVKRVKFGSGNDSQEGETLGDLHYKGVPWRLTLSVVVGPVVPTVGRGGNLRDTQKSPTQRESTRTVGPSRLTSGRNVGSREKEFHTMLKMFTEPLNTPPQPR